MLLCRPLGKVQRHDWPNPRSSRPKNRKNFINMPMRVKVQRAHWQSRWTDCGYRRQWCMCRWSAKDYQRCFAPAHKCVRKLSSNICMYIFVPCTYLCTQSCYFYYFAIFSNTIVFSHFHIFISPPATQGIDNNCVRCCTDLELVCKNIDDQNTQKQIRLIKTDSEKKCGANLDHMNATPRSGKSPLFVAAKIARSASPSAHHILCDGLLFPWWTAYCIGHRHVL